MSRFKKHIIAVAAIIAFVSGLCAISHTEHYIRQRVIRLKADHGSCSAEQVRAPSGVDYILTAAHCKVLEHDGVIDVVTEDGRELPRRIIKEDLNSDLLLLEGLPNLKGLEIAKYDYTAQHVRTFTHGKAMKTYKTEGELIQTQRMEVMQSIIFNDEDAAKCSLPKNKIVTVEFFGMQLRFCTISTDLTATTAQVVPGSSGGMVVNDDAQIVGVVSAGDGTFGFLVSLPDIQKFIGNF